MSSENEKCFVLELDTLNQLIIFEHLHGNGRHGFACALNQVKRREQPVLYFRVINNRISYLFKYFAQHVLTSRLHFARHHAPEEPLVGICREILRIVQHVDQLSVLRCDKTLS